MPILPTEVPEEYRHLVEPAARAIEAVLAPMAETTTEDVLSIFFPPPSLASPALSDPGYYYSDPGNGDPRVVPLF